MNAPAPFQSRLIHAARIRVKEKGSLFVFLKQVEPYRYVWFTEDRRGLESETDVWGGTAEEAINAAYHAWKLNEIATLNCGFRYTLPERDEVGTNALFHQMAASYTSVSGVYFDEELGLNCIVQSASKEALALWKRLQTGG